MNPSVDLRIASMIRVLRTLITPALQDQLAIEAANLVCGHLEVLRGQADHVAAFERAEYEQVQDLARELASASRGGPALRSAAARLDQLAEGGPPPSPAALRARASELNGAVIALLDAAQEEASDEVVLELRRLVLISGRAAADRNRAWFAGTGFDGAVAHPSIPDLMTTLGRPRPPS